jgi:hypothetical protein
MHLWKEYHRSLWEEIEITKAVKTAQKMRFMPVTQKNPACLKDPKVYNIKFQE